MITLSRKKQLQRTVIGRWTGLRAAAELRPYTARQS